MKCVKKIFEENYFLSLIKEYNKFKILDTVSSETPIDNGEVKLDQNHINIHRLEEKSRSNILNQQSNEHNTFLEKEETKDNFDVYLTKKSLERLKNNQYYINKVSTKVVIEKSLSSKKSSIAKKQEGLLFNEKFKTKDYEDYFLQSPDKRSSEAKKTGKFAKKDLDNAILQTVISLVDNDLNTEDSTPLLDNQQKVRSKFYVSPKDVTSTLHEKSQSIKIEQNVSQKCQNAITSCTSTIEQGCFIY